MSGLVFKSIRKFYQGTEALAHISNYLTHFIKSLLGKRGGGKGLDKNGYYECAVAGISVVYFDQRMGAAHAVRWSKSIF